MISKSSRVGVYSGKLFEYIAAQRPIIAIVDKNDVAAKLIKELNAGFIASESDINEIQHAILNCYQSWKNKKQFQVDLEEVKKLHRKFQVDKLNLILDKELND